MLYVIYSYSVRFFHRNAAFVCICFSSLFGSHFNLHILHRIYSSHILDVFAFFLIHNFIRKCFILYVSAFKQFYWLYFAHIYLTCSSLFATETAAAAIGDLFLNLKVFFSFESICHGKCPIYFHSC